MLTPLAATAADEDEPLLSFIVRDNNKDNNNMHFPLLALMAFVPTLVLVRTWCRALVFAAELFGVMGPRELDSSGGDGFGEKNGGVREEGRREGAES